MGDWGWSGQGDRGLEFPQGGTQVGVSPDGRARIRYNDQLNRFEQSLNGAPYAPFGGGGASSVVVEAGPAALSKQGGPGATDEVIGSTDVPALLLTSATQFLSTRIVAAPSWDATSNVTLNIGLALNGNQVNADTLDVNVDYIYARSGVAGLANLNKTLTSLSPQLTLATTEGLADETLYNLAFTLDRNDANNPYAGETTGGFGIRLNIDAGSSISSIYVVVVAVEFPTL